MKKKNGPINWEAFSENVEKVLGEDFWNDMHHVIPKRGPSYDFFETEDQAVLVIELPGLTKSDPVYLTQEGTSMIIRGEITPHYPVAEEDLIHNERLKGSFKRVIPVPFHFTAEDIVTAYKDGLLTVTIFKRQKNRDIPIELEDPQ
ncbi:Hsp20/alpha crystallin family protein [Halobacillus faecis]